MSSVVLRAHRPDAGREVAADERCRARCAAVPPLSGASSLPTLTFVSFGTQTRGSELSRRVGDTAKHAAARRDDPAPPCRGGAGAPAAPGVTTTRACAGTRGRCAPTSTPGDVAEPALDLAAADLRRGCGRAPARAPSRTSACSCGEPPATSTSRTANIDVSRAARTRRLRGRRARGRRASERGDGRQRRSAEGRSAQARRPRCARSLSGAGPRTPVRCAGPFPYSGGSSSGPRNRTSCSSSSAELVVHAAPRLGHQRERVGRGRAARVLDEVRVPLRDHRAADPVPLQPARLDQRAGAALAGRVLEHAAERPLRRRLRRLALREQLRRRSP